VAARQRLPRRHRALGAGARGNQAVARELIGALVHGVAGVTLDPVPLHVMVRERGVEPLP